MILINKWLCVSLSVMQKLTKFHLLIFLQYALQKVQSTLIDPLIQGFFSNILSKLY